MARSAIPMALVMVALLALSLGHATLASPDGPDDGGSRASWTVDRFAEAKLPVKVDFEEDRVNSTYHVSVPNSGTVTSASMTIGGVERYSLKGTPTDFSQNPSAGHSGYLGYDGPYPPQNRPSTYMNVFFNAPDEEAVGELDGRNLTTQTQNANNPPPFHYPYHLFDMKVDISKMVRLQVEWVGQGFCSENQTDTHGAQLWVWNGTGSKWHMVDSYADNAGTGYDVRLSYTFRDPWDFATQFGHVYLLVFGQHDERGPFGFPVYGQVSTDYVSVTSLENDTLERPVDVDVSIGTTSVWTQTGPFNGPVTIGSAEGLGDAIQDYVDAVPPSPNPVLVPVTFTVSRTTFGMVSVTSLSVGVREVENAPPDPTGNTTVEMTEDEDLMRGLDLRDYFDDDHQGPDLGYSVAYQENASAVQAVVDDDGHSVSFLTVADNWAGTLAFRFNATDAWGLSATSTDFCVTVAQVNDPPVLEDPGDQYIFEDSPFVLNVTALDPDLPYGDVLSYSDDTLLFDVDEDTGVVNFTPEQGDVGAYVVTVTVRDAAGADDSVTFNVEVVDVNDPPAIHDPGLLVVDEGDYFSHNFTAIDEDPSARFTWQVVGSIGSMYMGVQNGRLTWIPENEHVGPHNVTILARDSEGGTGILNVTILVVNVNDPPELEDPPEARLVEGVPFYFAFSVVDMDLEVDPGEGHSWSLDPPLMPISEAGVINFTPGNEHVGDHLINVTVTDSAGATASVLWAVSVANTNQPPVVEEVPSQIWYEDEPVRLVVNASDPDAGDVLTFSDSTSMFDIGVHDGVINFTPTQANVKDHDIRIRVEDSEGEVVYIYISAEVRAVNDAPVASIRVNTLEETLREGDQLSLAAEVSDEDNEREDMYFKWYLDGEAVGEGDTLVLGDLEGGDHSVRLTVSDGEREAEATYAFSVETVEEPFPWVATIVALVVLAIVLGLFYRFGLPLLRRPTG